MASDAVRRARTAAAADPSKLPRVAAAEAKGATDVRAVREKPTPNATVPAPKKEGMRKREERKGWRTAGAGSATARA